MQSFFSPRCGDTVVLFLFLLKSEQYNGNYRAIGYKTGTIWSSEAATATDSPHFCGE